MQANKCAPLCLSLNSGYKRDNSHKMSVMNPNKDSSHREGKKPRIIRLTHLLLQKLTVAPCRDFLHTMPLSVFAIGQTGCVGNISPVSVSNAQIFTTLLSPALHSLCALRIHDAKVRSANGFNGAPTIEISLPARY